MGLRRGHGTHELGALSAGTVEVGEEIPRGGNGRVVRGGAEAIHRLRGHRASLALPRQLVGGLAHLNGNGATTVRSAR